MRLAKETGMKYIVFTTKHHDGFAMFKSDASEFNIVDYTPYKKDIVAALAEACRRYDMKLGFYYSQSQDWCNPEGLVPGEGLVIDVPEQAPNSIASVIKLELNAKLPATPVKSNTARYFEIVDEKN